MWYDERMARRDPNISASKKILAVAEGGDAMPVHALTAEQLQQQVGALLAFDEASQKLPRTAQISTLQALQATPSVRSKTSALSLRAANNHQPPAAIVSSFVPKLAKKTPT